ncbi:retron-type reverse transcriptase [Rhodopirellula rubra]|uniref:RNA-directed DNA polymerase n=1 Tax=Aporhodopirellula rubra TaxID=980271 RepID=A0A7W5DV68_9BACT|nr:reverse transcriptase family protein [Aporhodopirellula rubra]MBB3205106.1 retron-type reverse transcriptase [Aporhodopirellula rubra]
MFEIRKRKKKRRIQAPRVAIKIIQKWFGHYFSRGIELPPYVVGFVPGRSSLDAAKLHCKKDWIFSTDIADFFQTTADSDVVDSLMHYGYTFPAAELITDLSCLGGSLAQGSPSSPVLANIAMRNVDEAISKLVNNYGATYTRYADDIVISGLGKSPSDLGKEIGQIFRPTTWKLAEHKTRLVSARDRMKVHGLLVHGEQPRLTKGYRRRLRAIRHLLEADKIPESDLPSALGHLAYARSVEGEQDKNTE